ncbi:MAG: hypothetical protein ACTSYW_00615 [Candidatus Heimdallarchaeota archaeon]
MLNSEKCIILKALEAGLENSIEVLDEYDQKYGRTKKNKIRTKIIESDIKQIKQAIVLLSVR